MQNRIPIEKINKTKSWLFEKISKTDQLLTELSRKKKREAFKLLTSGMKEGTSLTTLQK